GVGEAAGEGGELVGERGGAGGGHPHPDLLLARLVGVDQVALGGEGGVFPQRPHADGNCQRAALGGDRVAGRDLEGVGGGGGGVGGGTRPEEAPGGGGGAGGGRQGRPPGEQQRPPPDGR